ncbi:caspase recruitment domain-containing protein 14-like isoform X2 [Polyodon spathula]|uniref:caspase recruitment domain-containing protein 14-like isoform X2 n=1 Tax=Polyodon spathula TaxID=7913 RepID=UPI001B7D9BB5|nr:caspase recruitment domain-containing protein 14-like isoform X2 [Polyodon spathula]
MAMCVWTLYLKHLQGKSLAVCLCVGKGNRLTKSRGTNNTASYTTAAALHSKDWLIGKDHQAGLVMAGGVDLSGKELNDLDEEELWELINNHRDKITLGVKPCMLTAYLRQACVLSDLDEEEILHSLKNTNRCMRTGYMLDILKTRGKNGAIAFLESLMIHFPKLYTQVTGKEPTMEHSSGVMKHSELTEYLVKAMTEMQEVRSQEKSKALLLESRCFQLEAELAEAKRRVEELGNLDAEFKRLQSEFNLRYQELLRVKDEKCNLCMRYTSAVEESSLLASRCRDLQLELYQMKFELKKAKSESEFERKKSVVLQRRSEAVELKEEIESLNHKLLHAEKFDPARDDILVQDLAEAQQSRWELMDQIHSLREEAEKATCERDEHFEEKEALLLECEKLRLDCEMYQEKTAAFQVQLRELQKERDQVMELQGQIYELRKQATQMKGQLERQESRDGCETETEGGKWNRPKLRRMQAIDPSSSCSDCEGSMGSNERCPPGRVKDWSSEELNSFKSNMAEPPSCESISQRDVEGYLDGMSLSRQALVDWDSVHSLVDLDNDFVLVTKDLIDVTVPPPPSTAICEPKSGVFLKPMRRRAQRIRSRVMTIAFQGGLLLGQIQVVGGNETGIFVHSVSTGSAADEMGLSPGSQILAVEYELQQHTFKAVLEESTLEEAMWALRQVQGFCCLTIRPNMDGYQQLLCKLESKEVSSGDSFYIRVNLSMEKGSGAGLQVQCNDILHITDTLYGGVEQWNACCTDPFCMQDLDAGTIPNYYRAQMLLIKAIENMCLQHTTTKKLDKNQVAGKKKAVRIVSIGRTLRNPLWFSNDCEGNEQGKGQGSSVESAALGSCITLMPYTLVTPRRPPSKRPVLLLPNILGRLLNERLQEYQEFQLCQPELLSDSEFAERLKLGDILGVKERQKTYNCYTKQAVETIMEKNAHCLLEVELDCVRRMHKAEIFPIIIFIVTSEKIAKKLRKKLQRQGSSEEHLLECYKEAETLVDKLPCLTRTISSETWSDMESLISCVKAAVAEEQKKIVWIEQDLR